VGGAHHAHDATRKARPPQQKSAGDHHHFDELLDNAEFRRKKADPELSRAFD
jgi:hypothetical protein